MWDIAFGVFLGAWVFPILSMIAGYVALVVIGSLLSR